MKLAVIGDIHKAWNEVDVAYFNSSSYDAVLFVGDLPGRTHRGLDEIAREIARIEKPAYLIPGNHDGVSVWQLLAELRQNHARIERYAPHQATMMKDFEKALGRVRLVGFSRHALEFNGVKLDLVGARPHSMGGPTCAFYPYLRQRFGIGDLDAAANRLMEIVEECKSPILFLAHNGPTGLGMQREDIWGNDFAKEEGDFGDPDLRAALDHARKKRKKVLGVIAGHMHHRLKGSPGQRRWFLQDDGGAVFVNAARVPRIFKHDGKNCQHHISFEYDGKSAPVVTEVLLCEGNEIKTPAA